MSHLVEGMVLVAMLAGLAGLMVAYAVVFAGSRRW